MILERQNAVEELIKNTSARINFITILEKVYDIQRLSTKISNNSATPRDFLALKDTIKLLPELSQIAQQFNSKLLSALADDYENLLEFADIVDKTISEDAPVTIKEGNIIKAGVSSELDNYRDLLSGGKNWLLDYEEKQKKKPA